MGGAHECQPRLKVLTDALQRLARKGLTAPAVIANFHRQRVIPLMERRLAIFELTPEAAAEGSRMSSELLPFDAAAQRVRSAVAHYPSDASEFLVIKMRPAEGYIQLVSFAFGYRWFCVAPFPLPNLSRVHWD